MFSAIASCLRYSAMAGLGLLLVGNSNAQQASLTPGTISTAAGTGTAAASGSVNGNGNAATSANIGQPYAVATDGAGNFYFVDSTSVLRKITASTGIISTLAGTGSTGFSGDKGPGPSAALNAARGLCISSAGDVFIGDSGNNRVRLYYNGGANAASLLTVLGFTPTVGDIYTVAGSTSTGTTAGTDGDGGIATAGAFNSPRGCAVDSTGNLYVADEADERVRKVSVSNGFLSSVAGNGTTTDADGVAATASGFNTMGDVQVTSAGDLLIAEQNGYKVRAVYEGGTTLATQLAAQGIKSLSVGNIYTLAGTGAAGTATGADGDGGLASTATLNTNRGVSLDSAGQVYISDAANNRIRLVNLQGIISTIAGTGAAGTAAGTDGDGGSSTAALLDQPFKAAIDPFGNFYIADSASYRVRVVNVANAALAFPAEMVGQSSPAQTVLLTNSGSALLVLNSILLPSGFQLQTGTGLCTPSTTLVSGASCILSLEFMPVSAGNYTNQVQILSNGTNGSTLLNGAPTNAGTVSIAVSGSATAAGSTVTQLTASGTSLMAGQSLTLTATVTTPSGTLTGIVSFYDGATLLGATPLNASGVASYATSTLASGFHSLTASFAGQPGVTGSTSTPVTVVIRSTPALTLTATPNPAALAQPITFTAALSPSNATGTVTFFDGTTTLGTSTLVAGATTFSTASLTPGTHTITAQYAGDTNFNSITSSALLQSVSTQTILTVSISPSSVTLYAGLPTTFSVTATRTAGLTMTSSGAVAGQTLTILPGIANGTTTVYTATLTTSASEVSFAAPMPWKTALYAAMLLPLFAMRRKRKGFALLAVLAVCTLMSVQGLLGCSSPIPSIKAVATTPASNVIIITATSSIDQAVASASTTVTVQ